MRKKAKKRLPPLTTLRNKLDTLFSKWVRLSAASHNGMACCVTCKAWHPWQEMDAGHFVPRGCLALRWDERNVHPQCMHCNRFRTDMYADYALFMVDAYGRPTVDAMLAMKGKPVKVSRAEFMERIDDIAGKLADLALGYVSETSTEVWARNNV